MATACCASRRSPTSWIWPSAVGVETVQGRARDSPVGLSVLLGWAMGFSQQDRGSNVLVSPAHLIVGDARACGRSQCTGGSSGLALLHACVTVEWRLLHGRA